ncbi:hypothetical protein ONZ45_g10761 [Pleurotus djamor]|nr:hypothetical protein ONZ45_g10761 [Pleurotus djamor]
MCSFRSLSPRLARSPSPEIPPTPFFTPRPSFMTSPVQTCSLPAFENEGLTQLNLYIIPPVPNAGAKQYGREHHWCLSWTDRSPSRSFYGSSRDPEHHLHNHEDIQEDPSTTCGGIEEFTEKNKFERVTIRVAELSMEQLKVLERIAKGIPVQRFGAPCQDWCMALLNEAQKQGVLTREEVSMARLKASFPPRVTYQPLQF